MLALIKDNTIITKVREGQTVKLTNGDSVSPAQAGWSNADGYSLATILDADAIPDGKRSVAKEVELISGSPKWVHTLKDILPPSTDPIDYPLNPAQFEAITSILGVTIEQIDGAIDMAIADPVDNAFAKAKARKSTEYNRDNPLFALLGPLLSLTDAQIDAAWMQAKDLR